MRGAMLGLMSGLFLFSCDNDISFVSTALDACVRNAAPKYNDDYLTQDDLDKITTLICAGPGDNDGEEAGVTSLEGIERLRNLEELSLGYSHVYDLSPLSKLKELKRFGVTTDRGIGYFGYLVHLPLTNLGIHGAGLKDISFLSQIRTLEVLYLNENEIEDISVLAQLDKLVDIDLRYNKIATLAPLAQNKNLANMQEILLGYNCIDCVKDQEYVDAIVGQNADLYYICNMNIQLLPENCGE